MSNTLPTNTLAFMALTNEFCHAMESAEQSDPATFISTMVRLLPRIYMTAVDLSPATAASVEESDIYIDNVLSEEYYDSVRLKVENLLGADDVYLETFEEDMKYSDTPISASIAEGLTDIFQVLYNFLDMVRDAPADLLNGAISAVKEDFDGYWSQKVCNVMRPVNRLHFGGRFADDE